VIPPTVLRISVKAAPLYVNRPSIVPLLVTSPVEPDITGSFLMSAIVNVLVLVPFTTVRVAAPALDPPAVTVTVVVLPHPVNPEANNAKTRMIQAKNGNCLNNLFIHRSPTDCIIQIDCLAQQTKRKDAFNLKAS
jgi:hypothetical protein